MKRSNLMEPFAVEINFHDGRVTGASGVLTRKLSDLEGLFKDQQSYSGMLAEDNPVIYQVYEIRVPEEEGHLLSCTTVIYPGKVGNEYFFTKGHYHVKEDRAEIYTCLQGEGYLLMTTREGGSRSVAMKPGTSAYIPPYWSHRTLNSGRTPFVFHGVWPGDAGHDYDSIIKNNFSLRVFEINGLPVVVEE